MLFVVHCNTTNSCRLFSQSTLTQEGFHPSLPATSQLCWESEWDFSSSQIQSDAITNRLDEEKATEKKVVFLCRDLLHNAVRYRYQPDNLSPSGAQTSYLEDAHWWGYTALGQYWTNSKHGRPSLRPSMYDGIIQSMVKKLSSNPNTVSLGERRAYGTYMSQSSLLTLK